MKVTVEQIEKEIEQLSTEDLRRLLAFINSLLERESEKIKKERG